MPVQPAQLLAQSVVRLFGWVVVDQVNWREPAPAPAGVAAVAPAAAAAGAQGAAAGGAQGAAAGGAQGAAAGGARRAAARAQGAAAAGHRPLLGPQGAELANFRVLAHVLAFSSEGRYTPFRTPALFLVRDQGEWVWVNNAVDPLRLGLAQLDNSLVFASNLKFWICDRSAYITRLDVSAGTVQRMVIDLETSGAQGRRIDLVGQEGSYTARLGQGNH